MYMCMYIYITSMYVYMYLHTNIHVIVAVCLLWYFLNHNGIDICEITGKRKHEVGLEVPCTYTFYEKPKIVDKLDIDLTEYCFIISYKILL